MSFFDEENAPVLYNAVVGLCQTLAGGTLLYVTVFEIMDREKVKMTHSIVKDYVLLSISKFHYSSQGKK